jgi:uncharacterized protein (TIGR00251 family)
MPNMTSSAWYHFDSGGLRLILTLHIQPGAKQTKAVGLHGDAMKIRLAAPPVEGAANAALIEFLAGIFGVPRCRVTLKHGIKSRRKVVEISHPRREPSVLFNPPKDSDTINLIHSARL